MGNQVDADIGPSGLASLSIIGFRGIGRLQIPRLGRVTLLAGKNGVGKTTAIEALRVYAARGSLNTLQDVLSIRDELTTRRAEPPAAYTPALDRLFHNNGRDRAGIAIGPIGREPTLRIESVDDLSEVPDGLDRLFTEDTKVLRVAFANMTNFYGWPDAVVRRRKSEQEETPTRCESLGPGLPGNNKLAKLWDAVALTDGETLALESLRLVFGDRVERVAVIGDDVGGSGRRVVVKLANHSHPVPLRSLGDGATRVFGVALALANCRDGVLLIDEAENGIHYSLQSKLWDMVLCAAEAHNTQVVATTHSKDCIDGFAAAAVKCADIDGNLVRIGRHNGELRAVEYAMDELQTAAEQDIEVR